MYKLLALKTQSLFTPRILPISGQFRCFSNKFASRVLMVEPTHFYQNVETAEDNKMMTETKLDQQYLTKKAIEEFQRFREVIEKNDIETLVYKQLIPELPDSMFVNNWVSTHKSEDIKDGLFVLYPMKAASRESEKNPKIIRDLIPQYKNFIDLIRNIPEQALEGTGSLIFDNENRKIYVKLSARADADLLQDFLSQFNRIAKNPYRTIVWHQDDPTKDTVNHTNVIMSILRNHVVLCSEAIADKKEREKVLKEVTEGYLNKKSRKLLNITQDEMKNHCGNIIMLRNKKGDDIVVMSDRAKQSLNPESLREIETNYKVVSADLHTIEKIGGGSARSMLAELF